MSDSGSPTLNRLPSWAATRQSGSPESPLVACTKGGNLSELVKRLDDGADVNESDDSGNSLLIIAVYSGHEDILRTLINREADLCLRNSDDEDVFKVAVASSDLDMLKTLVESVADIASVTKYTEGPLGAAIEAALFIAANLGHKEKIEVLSQLVPNMNTCDRDGNTMFHYASKSNRKDVIDRFGQILDINVQNDTLGDSPLHVACKHGNCETILSLLKAKANVGLANDEGDTALHLFTKSTSKCDSTTERQESVLKQLVSRWLRYWFKTNSSSQPGDEAEYNKLRADAIHALFRERENDLGESVLSLAFSLGSLPVIEAYFSQENVTCFSFKRVRQYDITNLTPRTLISSNIKSGRSYLQLLLQNNPKHIVASVLGIEPIKKVEVMYSSLTTIIYLVIILLHTLYMSLFSYSSVVLMNRARDHHWDGAHSIDVTSIIFYLVVPIEPLFFLVGLIYRFHCSKTTWTSVKYLTPGAFLMQCFSVIHHVVYIFLVAALLYEYTTVDMYNTHNTLSVTLLVGWLTTLSFTQGLKPIRFFWRMIMHMIAVDVYKVLFVYVFVLLSFSFALHVQMQISSTLIKTYPTPFHTMFLVFRLMMGMGTLFDGEFENDIEKAGGSLAFPVLIYTVYIVLSSIVLLNLLIAMMNDSYSDILTNLKLSRRIETFQRAINLEKTVPWITRWISKRVIKCAKVDFQDGRLVPSDSAPDGLLWYVEVVRKEDETSSAGTQESRESVEDRLLLLENRISDQLESIQEKLEELQVTLVQKNKDKSP